MAAKVLSVGWDGVDLATVDSLIARGQLPNLARLRDSGLDGPLTPFSGLADDAHWNSFSTSTPPDVHGRFHHHQPVAGRYRQRLFAREAIAVAPFWERLAAAGLRVGVLDVPKSPLGQHPDLRVIADWMPHGEDGPAPLGTPPGLVEDLGTRYDSPPPLDCHRVIAAGEEERITATVRSRLELRTHVALDWLADDDWDLVQVVFAEGHCIGHHCWHVHDPAHVEHDPRASEELGDVVEDVYIRQDEALGRLISAAGPDATILVFSPLGMGPNYSGDALVQAVLDRLAGRPPAEAPFWAGAALQIPSWLSRRVPPLERRIRSLSQSPFRSLPYWPLRHDAISSAIRLNVVGRDRAGIINPGSELDHHLQLLTEAFRSLRRASSDTPVVADVIDVAATFPGPERHRFADLLIAWDTTEPIETVASPVLGTIVPPPKPARTGNHRPPGWWAVAGPGVGAASAARASLMDLGPTIAELLGVSLEGVHGRSLLERATASEGAG